jgi:succinoglycan biosynthesis protein ExoV
MQLYHWQGTARNFGDELNTLIWPCLLPAFFDDDPAEIFLGIGSVLDARHAAGAVKLVGGAGYGGYQALPALDARWVIHWVRGPLTCRLLGLPERRGLGDPAMLLPYLGWARPARGDAVGFMPHFESLSRGAWTAATEAAGVRLIDPTGDPAAIIGAIGNCRVLLSEALHGVIVADALRVPWVALQPLVPVHRAKWHDWAAALRLRIEFRPLAASSLPERLHALPLSATWSGRRLLSRSVAALNCVARDRYIDAAARALTRAMMAAPQLSDPAALDRCQAQMLDRLRMLRHDPRHVA